MMFMIGYVGKIAPEGITGERSPSGFDVEIECLPHRSDRLIFINDDPSAFANRADSFLAVYCYLPTTVVTPSWMLVLFCEEDTC